MYTLRNYSEISISYLVLADSELFKLDIKSRMKSNIVALLSPMSY